MAPRQNRFSTPFTPMRSPSQSLRRLRTAFSPSRNPSNPTARSASPDSTSSTSSSSMSPLTYSSMSPRTSSPADSHRSTASSIRDILRLRRQPSVLEVELEEERHLFGSEIDTCLEPRLSFGERNRGVEVGIFEVLDGRM
ncbi:hypothetical protein DM02DRAFT_657022 [Periconia macrospinosa]|uniref:Uncharacterized protein n=1 Tax=Periconia macrospinosa TaxID=97972 RepID=A0A2V1DNR0_9PLEO|nr:hypothetical protein DM02DRAFT_657022 [Periconia macrospinosa]